MGTNYSCIRHDLIDDPTPALTRLKGIIAILFSNNINHGEAWFLSSGLRLLEFDYQAAIEAGLKAVALKPNDPATHGYLAQIYSCLGKPQDALVRINYARRISPHYATWMLIPLIDIHCQLYQYQDALSFA